MKFLTLLKWKAGGAPPDPKTILMVNEATKAWIKAELAAGRLESAYSVLPNAGGYYGAGITNAASVEAAFQALTTYPAFFMSDIEVYPLTDVLQSIDDTNAAIKKMMG